MKKKSDLLLPLIIVGFVAVLCTLFIVFGKTAEDGSRTLDGTNAKIEDSTKQFIEESREAIIEYAKTAVPTVITNADGTTSTIDAPTVESIDQNNPIIRKGDYCPDGVECGLGTYIYAPTESYEAFKNYTIGKCWDVDGWYGAQCWDLSSLHSMNYTENKRVFSTCGTGAARGMWNCRDANAGSEYSLVYDKTTLRVGDIIVTNGGTYGHTCIVAGPYNNGYVACLGQNQGGSACTGGGAATNIINLSLNDFLGAFRPKTYNPTPTPTPTPTPASEVTYSYVPGDTFGQVLVRLGFDEGNLWGANGTVRYYTQQLIEQGALTEQGYVRLGFPFTLKRR